MNVFVRIIVKAITYFIYILPRKVQLLLGRILGVLWFDIVRIRRNVVLQNLRLAYPALTEQERVFIGRKSVIGLCHTLVEFCVIVHFKGRDFNKYFISGDLSKLQSEYQKGKGVLLLSLHTGNGDLATLGLTKLGYKVNLISKHFKSKWLNDLWFGIRGEQGTKFIHFEKSTFEILRALKRGEVVIFVLDQFMGPPVGARTHFFGVETGTAKGLAVFAQKSGAPVVPVYNFRREDGRIVILADPKIPFEESGERDDNIKYMTQKYTGQLEQIIRKSPDQWMWVHRRWKKFND